MLTFSTSGYEKMDKTFTEVIMPSSHETEIPRAVPFELLRPQLLQKLQPRSDTRVIALIAPGGFGKTTLLSQFARSACDRPIWLTLNARHADPTYFRQCLGVVLGLPEHPVPSADALMTQFNAHHGHTVLILDEIDHLGKESHAVIESLIRALNVEHRIYLAGYSEARLRLSRFIAQNAALVLTAHDLAFTNDETQAYLSARGCSERCITLNRPLEGWPVGLSLLANDQSAHLGIQDYLQDLMNDLPDSLSRMLPELAVLDLWDDGSPRALGLNPESGWLELLRSQGLPLIPLGKGQYRIDSLFRQMLLNQLKQRPNVRQTCYRRLAELEARTGQPLTAIQAYLQIEAYPEALHIASRVIPEYDVQGFEIVIKTTLNAFPFDALTTELKLILIENWASTGDVARAETAFLEMEKLHGSHVRYAFTCLNLMLRRGKVQQVMEEAALAAERVQGLWYLKYRRVQAQAAMILGQTEEANDIITTTLSEARAQHQLSEVAGFLHLQSSCLLSQLKWEAAEHTLEEAAELCRKLDMTPRLLHVQNTQAGLRLLFGKAAQALDLLNAAIDLSQITDTVMFDYLLATRGDTYLALQDYDSAINNYKEALYEAERRGRLTLYYHLKLCLCEALMARGDENQARHHLEDVKNAHHDISYSQGHLHFVSSLNRATSREALDDLEKAQHHYLTPVLKARTQLHVYHHRNMLKLNVPQGALHSILNSLPGVLLLERDLQRFPLSGAQTSTTGKVKKCCTLAVTVQTLGPLKIFVEDRLLKFQYTKSGEIFVWLALYGPSTRSQIISALWDGSNDPKHVNYFKVALRALRIAFTKVNAESNAIPFDGSVYHLNADLDASIDAQLLLQHARAGRLAEVLQLLPDRPLEFLTGMHSEWMTDARDTLTQDIIRATVAAAAQADPFLASRVLEHLISISPLQEDLYVQVLNALEKPSQAQIASRVYQRYAQMLRKEFDTEPDASLHNRYAVKALQGSI